MRQRQREGLSGMAFYLLANVADTVKIVARIDPIFDCRVGLGPCLTGHQWVGCTLSRVGKD